MHSLALALPSQKTVFCIVHFVVCCRKAARQARRTHTLIIQQTGGDRSPWNLPGDRQAHAQWLGTSRAGHSGMTIFRRCADGEGATVGILCGGTFSSLSRLLDKVEKEQVVTRSGQYALRLPQGGLKIAPPATASDDVSCLL